MTADEPLGQSHPAPRSPRLTGVSSTVPPPISRWGHAWRAFLVLALIAVGWTEVAIWQWREARSWFWADLAVGLVMCVVVWWRRRWPLSVAIITTTATVVSFSAGGPATLALFSLATHRRWRQLVSVGILAIAAGLLAMWNAALYEPIDLKLSAPVLVAIIVITVGWGMYVGSRRELLATLRERATTAEAEQAARVAQARVGERTRIAREMHDVLATGSRQSRCMPGRWRTAPICRRNRCARPLA